MKKLMAMILTLAMVMSLCVVPASAAGSGVAITITPDKESVDTATGDAVVTYTVKAKVTDSTLKVGALTITLDPSAGLELAAKSKDDEPAFFYEENQSLYYHKKYSPSGIFETVFSYAPLTKTFVATGATLDRNLNSTHGEVVLMTIMGKIAKGTTGTVTLGTTTCTYGDVKAEASHDCDVTPATVTITSATSNELSVAITKPVTGGTPETAISDTNYTGSITWAPTIAAGGKFAANTEYTANVKLTATGGYKFASDVKPIVAGATISGESVTDEGKTLTFKAAFPKTGNKTLNGIDIITNPALTLAVPTAAPNATATNERSLAVTGVYDDGSGGPVEGATWKIATDPIPKGVSLDGCTLKVTNEAEASNVRVEVTAAGFTDAEQVTITKEDSKATHIVATPPATTNITIPTGSTTTSGSCSYKVYDQYGAEMTSIGATWKMKLDPATVTGVTLTTDGAIAVTNAATTCKATLYAESGALKSNEITFNITREESKPSVVTITGAGSVDVPIVHAPGADGWNYATYTAEVKDQYNNVISNPGVEWSVTGATGVSIDKTTGKLTVTNKADAGTVTITAKSGTLTATLKVLDKDGDKVKITEKKGKYTFTMPASKVTVKGKFVEEAPEQIFADVPVDAYCYEAVKWAAEKGITGGVGNKLFAPNAPCTRAQIVTFLWRAAGSPAPKNMSSFADVPADAFYAKAVAWAVENGITGGTGDGKFSPDATCTRAQAVTFLYRAAGSPKVSSSAEFGDVATNAYYADAVAWAAKNGITGGIGGGLFGSGNDCTRAQIVTFLYRNYQSK